MTPPMWLALVGIVFTALGGLAWLGTLTWHGGKQAQKLENVITDVASMKVTQEEHSRQLSGWEQAFKLLEEVRHDVKNLLTGRVQPARRNSGTGD